MAAKDPKPEPTANPEPKAGKSAQVYELVSMLIPEGVLVELDTVKQSSTHPHALEVYSSSCEHLDSLIPSYFQALSPPLVPSSPKLSLLLLVQPSPKLSSLSVVQPSSKLIESAQSQVVFVAAGSAQLHVFFGVDGPAQPLSPSSSAKAIQYPCPIFAGSPWNILQWFCPAARIPFRLPGL